MIYAEYEDLDPNTRFKMEVSGWARPPYKEAEDESDRERIMETRLVLSEDFGPVNAAWNWINETDVTTGRTAFGYAAGVMCKLHRGGISDVPGSHRGAHHSAHVSQEGCTCPLNMPGCQCGHCQGRGGRCSCSHAGGMAVGVEMFGGLGDSKAFGLQPSRQEHYLGPTVMYHLSSHLMLQAELAIGLSGASDNLLRLNFGYEF